MAMRVPRLPPDAELVALERDREAYRKLNRRATRRWSISSVSLNISP